MPATVSVCSDNEGNKIIRSEKKDKDGKVITYRTKVASCSVVPVTKIRTIGTEFLIGEKMDADIDDVDGKPW